MSNALNWSYAIQSDGVVYVPFANAPTSSVDPNDIAEVAATVLTEDGHEGHFYDLTGPQALSATQQVQILAEQLSKPLSTVDIPTSVALGNFVRYGMSESMAEAVVAMFASALDPRNGDVCDDIRRVTGHRAQTFKQWVARNDQSFRAEPLSGGQGD